MSPLCPRFKGKEVKLLEGLTTPPEGRGSRPNKANEHSPNENGNIADVTPVWPALMILDTEPRNSRSLCSPEPAVASFRKRRLPATTPNRAFVSSEEQTIRPERDRDPSQNAVSGPPRPSLRSRRPSTYRCDTRTLRKREKLCRRALRPARGLQKANAEATSGQRFYPLIGAFGRVPMLVRNPCPPRPPDPRWCAARGNPGSRHALRRGRH